MKLMQRREVWLPTAWGWALVLVLIAMLGATFVRGLYPWLAVSDPVGAQVLVVEGWLGPRQLDEAITRYRSGRYGRVITTGGPLHAWPPSLAQATYAERAAEYLKMRGVPATAVPSPITPQDRTYYSALMVREWAQRAGMAVDAIDVVSEGPHARRSRLLYERAFGPQVRIGVLATRPADYDPAAWWRSSTGAREVWDQATGLAWLQIFRR